MRVCFRPRHLLAALELVPFLPAQLRFPPQCFFMLVKFEKEANLRDHGLGCERLHHVIDRALRIAFEDVLFFAAHRRDEDDRCVAGPLPLADQGGRLEPVQLRHVHVEENDGGVFLKKEAERLAP